MRLRFRDIRRPVAACDDVMLLRLIDSVVRRWPFECANAAGDPVIRITGDGESYLRTSAWAPDGRAFHHPVNAVRDLVGDLINAYGADNPDRPLVRCAAVETRHGLVLLADPRGRGKSMLAAHLALRGARVFADAVLPVDQRTGHGVALGILPCLSLPFPETAGTRFRDFVGAHTGPASESCVYLNLPDEGLAPFGETAPITGIVLLDRHDDAEPALASLGVEEALTALRPADPDRLPAVAAHADRLRLTYGDADEAAAFLVRRFGLAGSDGGTLAAPRPAVRAGTG